MSKALTFVAVLAAALALPAAAGSSWPQTPSPKLAGPLWTMFHAAPPAAAHAATVAPTIAPTATSDGFQYIGGEAGWQLAQHHYVVRDGRFVHASDCDHEIRMVARPTPGEIDGMQGRYPGA